MKGEKRSCVFFLKPTTTMAKKRVEAVPNPIFGHRNHRILVDGYINIGESTGK